METQSIIQIDDKDAEILNLLQRDGTQSYQEIGKKVGLSITAVNYRIKKLHLQGIILKNVSIVDPESVGIGLCAFLLVALEDPRAEGKFVASMIKRAEVQECHRILGEYSYLLKIRVRNLQQLEEFLDRQIKAVAGIGRIASMAVLSTQKETVELAVQSQEEPKR